jgi:hypothetical protein
MAMGGVDWGRGHGVKTGTDDSVALEVLSSNLHGVYGSKPCGVEGSGDRSGSDRDLAACGGGAALEGRQEEVLEFMGL